MSRMCYSLSNRVFTNGSYRLSNAIEKRFKTVNFLHPSRIKKLSRFQSIGSDGYMQKHVRYAYCERGDSGKLPTDVTGLSDEENFDTGFSAKSYCFNTPEEEEARSIALRNQLYKDSKDPLINCLKECSSEEEVFKLLEENYYDLNAEHVSQAVLVLRDLKVRNGTSIADVTYPSYVNLRSKYFNANNGTSNFQTSFAVESPNFSRLLAKINKLTDEFSIDALASTTLYLQKIGLSLKDPTLASLLMELEKRIDTTDCDHLPASALSKYSTVIRIHYHRWASLYLGHFAGSKAEELLDSCTNLSDLRHICIFYQNCGSLMTDSVMANIKAKITALLDNIGSTEPNTLLRIMFFLQQSHWKEQNYDLLLKMLKLSTENNMSFSLRQLLDLTEIFPGNCEPHSLLVLLNKHNPVLEQQKDSENKLAICFLQTVATNYSIKCQHDLQKELTESLLAPPSGQESMFFLNVLNSMMQSIKRLEKQVYLSYWSRVLKHTELGLGRERTIPNLIAVFNRYLMFNSRNLNIRHHNFEMKMVAWLAQDLKIAVEKYYPSYFARAVAYLLAYGQFRNLDYRDALINKLLSIIHRLHVTDWFTISVGLFTAMELRRKQSLTPEFLQQFVQLTSSLNKVSLNYLKENPSISIKSLGYLALSYQYRHGVVDSDLFSEIITRYKSIKVEDLTPRTITEIIRYFFKMDYFVPEVLETMAESIVKHNKELKANVAETVLQACFHFGYTPLCAEEFFPVLHELLNRDKEAFNCLHLIRAAISLAYFYQLPKSLIQRIFNIEFLDMVDQEIKLGSVKVFYTKKARNHLMELNRIVCLDYPEQDIPWFHARYCEDISAIDFSRKTSFHEDVGDVLVHLLGDKKLFLQNSTSPYFYKIDFEIFLDRKGEPVDAKLVKNPAAAYSRVAVLLLQKKDISLPSEQLKGFAQLKQRHLELMGYHVVLLSPILWNTMFMAEKSSKADYLRQQIWPKHKNS